MAQCSLGLAGHESFLFNNPISSTISPPGFCQHKDGQEHTATRKQKPELQPGPANCGKTLEGRFGELERFCTGFLPPEMCTAAT